MARHNQIFKVEVIRRALALFSLADQEKEKGNIVGVIKPKDNDQSEMEVLGRVTGI
ncbi:hypothetical protein [Pleionea litopenaei]|uniref:Uncharacterized protein n=1 Tax=Pleionea litopenaei TaxID=3070815 RepID=A0AA51X8H0_9GAMM|nr:hypothetical protein [Pleionea sp. HL-JVS1]WMS89303.1 hypothetical protein Q9312_19405 [Pleionea sp. HL-JVS1]